MPKIVNPAAETRDNGRMKNLTLNIHLTQLPADLPNSPALRDQPITVTRATPIG
jgi:hypothetical protein